MRAFFCYPVMMILTLAVFGCSEGGSNAPAPNAAHPQDWLAQHGEEARTSPNYERCGVCHGADLRGQGNALSCHACHVFNENPPFTIHPATWTDAYADHPAYALANGFASCALAACHGAGDIPQGGETAPSCATANFDGRGCHAGGPGGGAHPIGATWLLPSGTASTSHVLASIANPASCLGCHAATGGGIGPACSQCHTAHAPNNSVGTCNSCHNAPPDSAAVAGGDARPNRAGAHPGHGPFTMSKGNCTVCHNGAGTDTISHYDTTEPANVALLASYNAKTGAAGYNETSDSCSNVSCHGGQPSPAWLTGTLDVNTGCSSCHEAGSAAQTPQFNSYYSGLHSTHVSRTTCAGCHDVAALAPDHFVGLDTPAFEGDPALTMAAALGYNAVNSTCTTNLANCHPGQTRGWTGGGGASHPVNAAWLLPSGTASTSHVLASIANPASCLGCHAATGGGIGPACSQCHTAHAPNNSVGTCNSCHNAPPDSAAAAGGDARPNRAGAHAGHDPFTLTGGDCAVCHNGAGTDTISHYDATEPANVAILATYNAKTGAAGYNETSDSCTNVSCHGGQPSPAWLTGTLDVNTGCRSCHEAGSAAQTPQFNSYYSGLHSTHVSRTTCAVCHNVAALAPDHFVGLDTPAFEGDPALTMAAALGYNAVNSTCTTNLANCHPGQTRGWAGGGGASHPVNAAWLLPSGTASTSHVLASNANPASCLGCHAATGGGIGPACSQCHTAHAPNNSVGTCNSCHNAPPDSAAAAGGDARPNRAGAHAGHDPFTLTGGDCAVCHSGAGTDTINHYDATEPANVAILATYNAKTGAAGYAQAMDSCTNVSCHGGQPSPGWLTGTLDVNTQCSSCHQAGTAQYNSYTNPNNESHTYHIVNRGFSCVSCHNVTTLATSHFTNLDTQAMEGPASATIGGGATQIPAGSYIPATRSCDPTCHGQENW